MKYIYLVLLFAFSTTLLAQKKEVQLGIGGQVFYSHRVWLKTADRYDSILQGERGISGISPQIWSLFYISKNLTLQAGVAYTTYGFQQRSKNLDYKDKIHPDLPTFNTNLQGDPVYYDFFLRNHQITLPVLFNREIIAFRKTISLRYYFSPGISISYAFWDKVIAKSRGFGYDGKNRFVVNNLYQKQPFNVQLHLGGRMEYRVSAKYRAHVQPVFNLPVTPVYKGDNKALIPSVGVNFVISLLASKIDEKE